MQIFKNLSRKTGQREETSTLIWYQKAIKDKSRGGGGEPTTNNHAKHSNRKTKTFPGLFPFKHSLRILQ